MKDRIAGIVADPRLWAYVAGITALLLFVVHKFVKGPE